MKLICISALLISTNAAISKACSKYVSKLACSSKATARAQAVVQNTLTFPIEIHMKKSDCSISPEKVVQAAQSLNLSTTAGCTYIATNQKTGIVVQTFTTGPGNNRLVLSSSKLLSLESVSDTTNVSSGAGSDSAGALAALIIVPIVLVSIPVVYALFFRKRKEVVERNPFKNAT